MMSSSTSITDFASSPRPSNSASLWIKILTASSSSHALQLASNFHPDDLSTMPFPCPVHELSKQASDNAYAIRRSLGVTIPGLNITGWELWTEEEDDDDTVATLLSVIPRLPTSNSIACAKQQLPIIAKSNKAKEKESQILSTPSNEDIIQAKIVQTWAHNSPHLSPSTSSLTHICNSSFFPFLLESILLLPPSVSSSKKSTTSAILPSPPILAALLTTLSDHVPPSHSASSVLSHIIFPYLCTLKTPSSRDMLAAIIHFTSRHWRPTTSLIYYPFASSSSSSSTTAALVLNTPVAEVLSRVATQSLPAHAARDVLSAFCAADATLWTDATLQLIDTLFTRSMNNNNNSISTTTNIAEQNNNSSEIEKDPTDTISKLVTALSKNVIKLEKSIRFGKLVFKLVKEIPQIQTHAPYKTCMQDICTRSKVFLSKRALTLLSKQS